MVVENKMHRKAFDDFFLTELKIAVKSPCTSPDHEKKHEVLCADCIIYRILLCKG